ncbi:glycoside hydrolase family 65 protein [Lysobacter korlensis]|uniref:Glycoside hydrolase family 65 protein n=1 Tax=Lysobacter korlensis TaxID=553636 RepID=A0ABV6RQH1_9GAMM
MTDGLRFDLDPWSVGLHDVDLDHLGHVESVFALSNGNVGWRGNLDEGEPRGVPGSYLNGVFERHPMPYAEGGYGYPSSGQSAIDVPDGKILRLLVDDEPLDLRTGRLGSHERRLDFRSGTLRRELEWTSPAGRTVRVTSERLVSLTHRSVAALRYQVEPVDGPALVTLQSELIAGEQPPTDYPDPRVQEALSAPLRPVAQHAVDGRVTLLHRTRRSDIGVAVAMEHLITAPRTAVTESEASPDLGRTTIAVGLEPGERLLVVKIVAHEWSAELSPSALRDRAEAGLREGLRAGWEGLATLQRERLDDYWACAAVEIDGDPRLQQAVRFGLFHVFQSAARADLRPVPGKGLTGPGYDGHTFWDSEGFVLPVLTYTAPEVAANALRWRHATLGHARDRARQLHFDGAAFPWRTIDGQEASGYWPAGTIAFHINADIAAAVLRHVQATGDAEFEREVGVELVVETARLWMSIGRWDDSGRFHIDGVTGPDEYTAMVDDNVFTNLMAQQNLSAAADLIRRYPENALALKVDDAEVARWTGASAAMTVLYDERRGVHPQSAGFTDHERWDFDSTPPGRYPLQDHYPYFDLYRKQVVKQADLVLAMHFRHDAFTPEQKARNFAYYEALTVRDSSLSAASQAVIAAEVGHLELAADYLAEAALLDLDDIHRNTDDGLHIASLAGMWVALTAGFGGMRHGSDGLRFEPRLPPSLARIAFGLRIGSGTLRVEVRPDSSAYSLVGGTRCALRHFGEPVTLDPGESVTLPTPPLGDVGPAPEQPPGRSPREMLASRD